LNIIEDTRGIEQYLQAIQNLQTKVIHSQRQLLSQAAAQMVNTILQDGRIFVFGTGHSHLMAEEAFYRAGGLAAAVPIFSPMLMLHENPYLSGRLERTSGIVDLLLDEYDPRPGEMIFVYSNSGVNRVPVEMALLAKKRGLFVVSVSSFAYSKVAPLSELGKRLSEVSDISIDNGGEPGDALVQLHDSEWRVAPSSTVIGALIWNCLVAETAQRLQAAGETVPVFISCNMQGAAEHNQALLDKYRKVNPHL